MGETFYDAPHNSFGSLAARGPDNDEERCPFVPFFPKVVQHVCTDG